MKVAKLEIKMIVALVLSRYEYELVNVSGGPSKQLPKPNRNDIHQVRLLALIHLMPNANSVGRCI
jgi:sterol 14-demethylase